MSKVSEGTPLPDVAGLVERLRRGNIDQQAACADEAADLITDQARQLAERDAEIAALKDKMRKYTPEEIELFQKCFDRGLIGVDELTGGTKAEAVAKARQALENGHG